MLICRAWKDRAGEEVNVYSKPKKKHHVVFHSSILTKSDSQQSLLCSAGTRTAVEGETAGQEEGALAELS